METAEAVARLSLDNSAYKQGLAQAEQAMDKFSANIGEKLNGLGKVFVGAFAFDKLISGFSRAIEKGDQLQDIAEKFGVSASKLQMLGNAASVFGSGIENVSAGLNKLSLAQQKAISGEQGSEALLATFAEVGLSLDQLKRMTVEDVFLKISDSFASGANAGRQFIIVNELLGKAQTDLIKVMNQGSAAIIEQGMSMGTFTDEQIANLSAASDSLKHFETVMTKAFGTVAQYATPLISLFERLAEQIGFVVVASGQLAQGNFSAVADIANAADRAFNRKQAPSGGTISGQKYSSDEPMDIGRSGSPYGQDPVSSAIEAAYKLSAKFDNDRLDYNRKEADRIAKLDETRAAQKEADQRAYFEKQSKDQKDYSARQDRQTMLVVQAGNAYMDAFTSKNNFEADIAGRGLASSRRGSQYLDQARRNQANSNRTDNYKFNEEQVQKYVDRMQQRGNGQSDKDFERYKNMTPDQARETARRDLAKQQAQKENPSDREKAANDLKGYLEKVDSLLTQLTQYAHVTG